MLIRFTRKCHFQGVYHFGDQGDTKRLMNGHQWMEAGGFTVARVHADHGEVVDLEFCSEGALQVPKDAFEIIAEREVWTDAIPAKCECCGTTHPEPAFWRSRDQEGRWWLLCNACYADGTVDRGFQLGPGVGQRYECDPEDGAYVNTALNPPE